MTTPPGPQDDGYADLVEAAKARAEFQREVYRTRDAKIAAADGTATALAATAAAIAAFGVGALVNANARWGWMLAVALLAVVGAATAIWSRAEIPVRTRKLAPLLDVSGKAVADVHAARGHTALDMQNRVFETWRAMTHSAQGREYIKRRLAWCVLIPIALEVLVFGIGMRDASPGASSTPINQYNGGHHRRSR